MSETSGKYDRKNSRASRSGISSRALVAGPSLFDWLDGQTNGQFSRDHAPALPFPQPEKRKRAPSAKAAKLSRIRTRLECLLASGAAMNGLLMGGTCGPNCGESSGDSDRRLRWESRLRERMELYGSVEYGLRWNTLDTPLGEPILQRRALGHRTSGNDCSGWPTANAGPMNDTDTNWETRREQCKQERKNGNGFGMNLGMASTLVPVGWPTTKSKDGREWSPNTKQASASGHGLGAVAQTAAGWGTPACRDAKDAGCMDAEVPINAHLGRQATMLVGYPTPNVPNGGRVSSCESMSTTGQSEQGKKQVDLSFVASTMPGVTKSQFSAEMENAGECPRLMLNPAFSGWLMGYPLEWVTAGRRAMEAVKSRKRSTRSRRRKPDGSDS